MNTKIRILHPHVDTTDIFNRDRSNFVQQYAWSIPNEDALEAIMRFGDGDHIEEHMAGSGYWGYLLQQLTHQRVRSFELQKKTYKFSEEYKDIEVHNAEDGPVRNDTLVFLSWPPMSNSAAKLIQKMAPEQKLVYIGEGWGGCNAEDSFFEELEKNFDKVQEIDIQRFQGLNDYMHFYIKKVPTCT